MATSGEPQPALPAATPPRFLEGLCAALVLLSALLLASFPDSDVWMHLAAGRALVDGTYSFGADPFAYTTAGATWINHAWLWDLLSYGVDRWWGADALVALKAVLVAATAAVMLCLAWRGAHRWVGVFCVALAVLALSPYLALRPTCVSYLFLSLTLGWLERPWRTGGGWRRTLLHCLPLPLLFALWVNLDEWFLLGPLAVAIYLLGTVAQQQMGPEQKGEPPAVIRALALTLGLGLAACLLNPYHFRAFTLPAALDLSVSRELPELGLPVSRPAYAALLVLGLVGFLVNRAALRWPRALLWLALLVLGVFGGEAAAFFAVVAGPLTALNLQEFFARRGLPRPVAQARMPAWGHAGFAVALAGLATAAWLGWPGAAPSERRRWAVEVEPSLAETAAQLERWRAAGRITAEARGFNLSPAAADVFAWLCPKERGFLDSRAHLFPAGVATDFHTVRRALLGLPAEDWRGVLRRAKVTHLILHDPVNRNWIAALRTVFAVPGEWSLVALHGRTAVFVWRDPADPDRPSALRVPALDLQAWAFRPPANKKAPAAGPGREPTPRGWWDAFWKPRPQPDVNRDEALGHLLHFEVRQPLWLRARRSRWEGGLAGAAVGTGVPGSFPAAWAVQLPLLETALRPPGPRDQYAPFAKSTEQFIALDLAASDDGPASSLLSAVRAARRALHADPDDPLTHLVLGQAYLRLLRGGRERSAARTFPLLERVRIVQAVTALKHAVRLDPDLLAAHEALARLYQQTSSLDLELAHRQEELRCLRAAGRKEAETPEQFTRRLRPLEEAVEKLGRRVREALNLYETRAFGRDDLGRARAALEGGLAGTALEILNASRYEAFGVQGAVLQLELFLSTGRVKEVREWMEPGQERVMGRPDYRRLQAQLAAATGDYVRADEDLRLLAVPEKIPTRTVMALLTGQFVLQSAPSPCPQPQFDQSWFLGHMATLALSLRAQGDLAALRGLLALEAGETAAVARLFRESLALWDSEVDGAPALARHFLRLLQ
jgi:hypothetical protein